MARIWDDIVLITADFTYNMPGNGLGFAIYRHTINDVQIEKWMTFFQLDQFIQYCRCAVRLLGGLKAKLLNSTAGEKHHLAYSYVLQQYCNWIGDIGENVGIGEENALNVVQ